MRGKFASLVVRILITVTVSLSYADGIKANSIIAGIPLQDSPLTEIWTAVGLETFLPCNITAPVNDSPQLVIVYKGTTPIYSIDARFESIVRVGHWLAPGLEDRRITFVIDTAKQGIKLPSVVPSDSDDYYCRVDFHESPTRNSRIKVHVAEPPSSIIVKNEVGSEVQGIIGPYSLGGTVKLKCEVIGGKPTPFVGWWNETALIDGISEVRGNKTIINAITIYNLTRDDLFMQLVCKAKVPNITRSFPVSLKIDLTFPPTSLVLLGTENPLRANWTYDIVCEIRGSRPPPAVTWWKDDEVIDSSNSKFIVEWNVTRSILEVVPKRRDDGANYTCQARNDLLPLEIPIRTSKIVDVLYPPEVHLRPGDNINIEHIKEHDDAYFECGVHSNPKTHHIRWFIRSNFSQETEELRLNLSHGILKSDKTLVLQNVSRFSSGSYVCIATNSVASSTSNELLLNVQFKPVCSPGQEIVYGSAKYQKVKVACAVESFPPPKLFVWVLNTTNKLTEIMKPVKGNPRHKSSLIFSPKDEQDYGTVSCWAVNDVGKQERPCVFQIFPAGPPESPKNCSAWQRANSSGAVIVSCGAGQDGGLPQSFSLDVRSHPDGNSFLVVKSKVEPRFTIQKLLPGTEYLMTVQSINSQGFAPPKAFFFYMPIDIAEERLSATAAEKSNFSEKLIIILSGALSALVLTCVVLTVAIRYRLKHRRAQQDTPTKPNEITSVDSCTIEALSPDILSNSEESSNICDGFKKSEEFTSINLKNCEECNMIRCMSTLPTSSSGNLIQMCPDPREMRVNSTFRGVRTPSLQAPGSTTQVVPRISGPAVVMAESSSFHGKGAPLAGNPQPILILPPQQSKAPPCPLSGTYISLQERPSTSELSESSTRKPTAHKVKCRNKDDRI